jgi:hypothetical protein
MVPVRDYKTLWDYVKTQETRIDLVVMVDDETELTKKIEEAEDQDIILVAVYPSADQVAFDEDNYSDVDTCIIYILQKVSIRNMNDEDLLTERALTQEIMMSVRDIMADLMNTHADTVYHRMMKQLIRGKQHIDRERNYVGCNGYSLSFGIKTLGFNNDQY